MRNIYPCIEQLDLAAIQLQQNHPSYSRFALILTDNIIELMLHKQCEVEFQNDQLWKLISPDKQKYSTKLKQKVLGQQFIEKLKFVRRLGKISDDEKHFILVCHKYRNELYHSGIKHDDIIYPLAWYYHDIVCDMFPKLKMSYGYSWSSRDFITEAVKKHAGEKGIEILNVEESLAKTAESLKRHKPDISEPLPVFLSEAAIGRIGKVQKNLKFLVADNPQGYGEAEMIKHIQFYDFLETERERPDSPLSTCKDHKQFFQLVEKIKDKWQPKVGKNPISGWWQNAKDIATESNDTKGLLKFERLRANMMYFDGVVTEAAISLDGWIQEQIDIARGK